MLLSGVYLQDDQGKRPLYGGQGEMDLRRLKIHNTLIICVLLTFILVVGVWGDWFGPLELATCTARGGQIVGDYGSGDV